MLTREKAGKYIKYAICEIILVVIGILIAVFINGKYQDYQDERKVDKMLSEIRKDLIVDSKDAHRILKRYIQKSKDAYHVLNDSLSMEIITDKGITDFFNKTVSFSNNRTSYSMLMDNI